MINHSQDIMKKQFQQQLKVPSHQQTLLCNTFIEKKYFTFFRINIILGRSQWWGQECHDPFHHSIPHFNFQTKQGQQFQFQTSGIAFNGCSEIIQTRNVTIFTVYATVFGQFTAAYHLF